MPARPAETAIHQRGTTHASMASGLAASFTPLSEAQAVQLTDQIYGIRGHATRFATEKDDTFRIDATSGERYVLKVSNPGEPITELDLQVAVMRHLEEVAPALPVPRVLNSVSDQALVQVMVEADEPRVARLYTYIDGIPLDHVRTTSTHRYEIGEVLAQLRLATTTFTHPADRRVLPWDVKHFPQLEPLIEHVDNHSDRAMIDEAFDRFAQIEYALKCCPTQVLHNDFNRSNIVTRSNAQRFVSGIIDFGDTVHTAVAIDVATAVMNQFPLEFNASSPADLFEEPRDLVRGYLAHAVLSEEELRLVPHLAMARVAARALLTTWRAKLFPQNEAYILRFTRPGWEHLRWFMRHDPDAVSDALLTTR